VQIVQVTAVSILTQGGPPTEGAAAKNLLFQLLPSPHVSDPFFMSLLLCNAPSSVKYRKINTTRNSEQKNWPEIGCSG